MSRAKELARSFGYEGNGGYNQKRLKAMRESARKLEAIQDQKEKKKPNQNSEPDVLPASDEQINERHKWQVLTCLSHLQNERASIREIKYLQRHGHLIPPQLSHIEIPEIMPRRRLSNAVLQRLGLEHY